MVLDNFSEQCFSLNVVFSRVENISRIQIHFARMSFSLISVMPEYSINPKKKIQLLLNSTVYLKYTSFKCIKIAQILQDIILMRRCPEDVQVVDDRVLLSDRHLLLDYIKY